MRADCAAVISLVLTLFLTGHAGAEEGVKGEFTGKVVRGGAAAAGVLLEVHLEARGAGDRTPAAVTESGDDGTFVMSLPPGEYHLSAKVPSSRPGPPMIVEHPDNPFDVRADERAESAPMDLSAGGETGEEPPPLTGVKGRILIDGEPASGASVMIYDAKVLRPVGPRYASRVQSGPDGLFEAPVPPGTYLLAVRKRQRGTAFGPPQPGDHSAEYEKNPVKVESGRLTETGAISLHVVDPEELVRRLASLDSPAAGTSSITGKVLDGEGTTLPGQFVFLYRNAEMTGPPVFVTRSGEDGGFILNPPGAGRYYIAARRKYGAAREPGDYVGRIEGSSDSSVDVREGKGPAGLVIRMEQMW